MAARMGPKLHRVFVYGILKSAAHHADPPESVPGRMYLIDGYAACVFGKGVDRVRGELREVDTLTLRHWDEIEDVAGGLYRRVKVRTLSGIEAWAYEYARDVAGAPVIQDGIWRGHLLRDEDL